MKELELYSATGRKVSVQWTPDGILMSMLISNGTRAGKRSNFRSKLTAGKVQVIRGERAQDSGPLWDYCKRMGTRFEVTPAAIHHVLSKRTWKNV